jgi:hypothetical protein
MSLYMTLPLLLFYVYVLDGLIPGRGSNFSLRYYILTDSGAQPDHLIGIGDIFPVGKEAGECY